MARTAAAYGKIDWASASVRDGVLTLALEGERSRAWTARFAALVAQLEPQPGAWTSIAVTREHVRVQGMRPGIAPDLYAALMGCIGETNATFVPATVLDPPVPVEHRRGRALAVTLGLVLLAVAAVALQWAEWEVPVRAVVVVGFVVLGPGWAILRLWGLTRGWEGAALVPAVSLALAMVVAGAFVYADAWSPLAALSVLAGITVLAALASFVLAVRAGAGGSGDGRSGARGPGAGGSEPGTADPAGSARLARPSSSDVLVAR